MTVVYVARNMWKSISEITGVVIHPVFESMTTMWLSEKGHTGAQLQRRECLAKHAVPLQANCVHLQLRGVKGNANLCISWLEVL
jgi:hypothetical protein